MTYYQRSRILYQKAKNKNGEGIALIEMGNANYSMSQYQQALTHYQEALEIFQNILDRYGEGIVFLNFGNTYLKLRQYQKALESYQQVQIISKTIGVVHDEALAFCGMGYVEKPTGQYEQALSLLGNCLGILKRFDPSNTVVFDHLWLAQAQLGSVEALLKKYPKAIDYYHQALENLESLRTSLDSETSKLQFIQDKHYVYDEFLQLLQSLHQTYPSQGYDYESLKVFEKKQGRIFVEKIGKSGTRHFALLPIEKRNQEEELENQVNKIRADLISKLESMDELGGKETKALMERLEKLKKEQKN